MTVTEFTLPDPIDLAIARDEVLYILAGGKAYAAPIVVGATLKEIPLPFRPTTWAYGQFDMTLYNPEEGLALVRGIQPVKVWTGEPPYAAPYGAPFSKGKPLLGELVVERRKYLKETNGYVWAYRNVGKTEWVNPHFGRWGKLPILAADPGNDLVIQGHADAFVVHHGYSAPLLYAAPPQKAVPYTLVNGLVLIGCEDGYCFSPDGGKSWRRRKLDGFGVITDRAILYVNSTGLYLHRGATA